MNTKKFFAKVQETFQRSRVATLCLLFGFGRNQSSDEIPVSAKTNPLFNPLKFKIRNLKIFKTPFYFSGMFTCLLIFTFFTSVGCEKPTSVSTSNEQIGNTEENNTISIPKLAGTKWKLVGYVSIQNQKTTLIEAEPKDCEECYTFTFDTDSTGEATTVCNIIWFNLLSNISLAYTLIGDGDIGNCKLFYKAIASLESYSVENGVLKIYYNNNQNYLHYKLLEQ